MLELLHQGGPLLPASRPRPVLEPWGPDPVPGALCMLTQQSLTVQQVLELLRFFQCFVLTSMRCRRKLTLVYTN